MIDIDANKNRILLLLLIIIIIMEYNIKYYLIIMIILYWLYSYNNYVKIDKKKDFKDKDKDFYVKLKKFKKYNKNQYRNGKNLLKRIMKVFNNREKFKHKNYQYDNLKFTIQTCLNNFNSILLNLPNNRLSHSINYKDIIFMNMVNYH